MAFYSRSSLGAAAVAAAALVLASGTVSCRLDAAESIDESEIDLARCAAWKFKCPEVKGKCDKDWTTRPQPGGGVRDPAWGACPAPPAGGCTQVILGIFDAPAGTPNSQTVKGYIGCPGYIALSVQDWTEYTNDRFIACAAAGQLGTCDPAIRVVTPESLIPNPGPGQRVTSREVCQLLACSCDVKIDGTEVKVGACPAPKAGKRKPAEAKAGLVATTDDDEACVACETTETTADGAAVGGTCGECETLHLEDCYGDGAACAGGGDCCSGHCNEAGECEAAIDPPACQDAGASCSSSGDCCAGTCTGGSCTGPVCTTTPTTPTTPTTLGEANAIAVQCEALPAPL